VTSAAGDRGWGTADVVSVRPGGRIQVGADAHAVDAATVYQAARGLVGALLDDLVEVTGRPLEDIVAPWLLTLQLSEAVADVEWDQVP
jgi:hypothetical protein